MSEGSRWIVAHSWRFQARPRPAPLFLPSDHGLEPSRPPTSRCMIAPLKLEIAPGKVVHTVAYNDRVPGPLHPLARGQANRDRRAQPARRSLRSSTGTGFGIPSDMDGAAEEGSPMIAPGGKRRYTLYAAPFRLPLVSHAQLCRPRPQERSLYRAVRLSSTSSL